MMIGTETSLNGAKVWVVGHNGMVGAALLRRLHDEDCEVITVSRGDVDLRDQKATMDWTTATRPDFVFCAAAKVGGIHANEAYPVEFLCDNLRIQLNVIDACYQAGVSKLLFLGSSCIYPRDSTQPIQETELMTGPLEPTNQWYATAKIAGILQCRAYRHQHNCNFISAMPTNLYGPRDNYHPTESHVVAALIRKIHEAHVAKRPSVAIWGSGMPRREFLYVDDCADALVFLMRHYNEEPPINVGVGQDISITELAAEIADVIGYSGSFEFDTSKPDGTPRKLLDVSRMAAMGWRARTPLQTGLAEAYRDFLVRTRLEGEVRRA